MFGFFSSPEQKIAAHLGRQTQLPWWFPLYLWCYALCLRIYYLKAHSFSERLYMYSDHWGPGYIAEHPISTDDADFAHLYLRRLQKCLVATEVFYYSYLRWHRDYVNRANSLKIEIEKEIKSIRHEFSALKEQVARLLENTVKEKFPNSAYSPAITELITKTTKEFIIVARNMILTSQEKLDKMHNHFLRHDIKNNVRRALVELPTHQLTQNLILALRLCAEVESIRAKVIDFEYEFERKKISEMDITYQRLDRLWKLPEQEYFSIEEKIKVLLFKYHPDRSIRQVFPTLLSTELTAELNELRQRAKYAIDDYSNRFLDRLEDCPEAFNYDEKIKQAWLNDEYIHPATLEANRHTEEQEYLLEKQKRAEQEERHRVQKQNYSAIQKLVSAKIAAIDKNDKKGLAAVKDGEIELLDKTNVTATEIRAEEKKIRRLTAVNRSMLFTLATDNKSFVTTPTFSQSPSAQSSESAHLRLD